MRLAGFVTFGIGVFVLPDPLPQSEALLTGEGDKNTPFSTHLRVNEQYDMLIERLLTSLRFEQRGKLEQLSLEKDSLDVKTSYNSIKPTADLSLLRNTRYCPKDYDNLFAIDISQQLYESDMKCL